MFAVSDIHVDYRENKEWLFSLSSTDYLDDVLIIAGDLTDDLKLLEKCFIETSKKFLKVLFIPGNHELWVNRDKVVNSFEKCQQICDLTLNTGVSMRPAHFDSLSIVPLFSWYDYSFAKLNEQLKNTWMDFKACIWPDEQQLEEVTRYFLNKNKPHLNIENKTVISFSHFLPRIDLMPIYIPPAYHYLYPVLGSESLEQQVRQLMPDIHVYGHSHVNRKVTIDDIQYINNAFGYPAEDGITVKELVCIYQC